MKWFSFREKNIYQILTHDTHHDNDLDLSTSWIHRFIGRNGSERHLHSLITISSAWVWSPLLTSVIKNHSVKLESWIVSPKGMKFSPRGQVSDIKSKVAAPSWRLSITSPAMGSFFTKLDACTFVGLLYASALEHPGSFSSHFWLFEKEPNCGIAWDLCFQHSMVQAFESKEGSG